jgi:hypothetical protein
MSYDPNEARDDHGRWTSGAGGYGNSALALSSPIAVSNLAKRSLKVSIVLS